MGKNYDVGGIETVVADRVRVSLEVTGETKAQWEQYVEDNGYGTLSGMVRRAVAKEIDGDDTEVSLPDRLDHRIETILGAVQEVQRTQESMEKRIDQMESEMQQDQRLNRMTSRVMQVLPSEDHQARFEDGEVPRMEPDCAPSGRLPDIAGVLDADPVDVQRAVEKLLDESHRVRVKQHEGEEVYYLDA